MTAYIAQLEQSQATTSELNAPATDNQRHLQQTNRNVSNPDVLKAKEDRAKLQGFIVTAGNLDDQRADGPRPVTPMRPLSTTQLPLVSFR